MRHDVLDVELEQRLGRDLVVHEHAGAAQVAYYALPEQK